MIVNDVSFGGMYSAAFKVKVLGEDERPVTNASVLAAFWDANAPGYIVNPVF
jgi:protocatechuate 3,4-dioxygenase beta subunit